MTLLESNFLVPNGSFLVAALVLVLLVALVIGGVVWLVLALSGRGQAAEH